MIGQRLLIAFFTIATVVLIFSAGQVKGHLDARRSATPITIGGTR